MNKLFELSVEDILNKQFHADIKGYNSLEVDEFLDLVMKDYQTFHEKMKETSETMRKYEDTIEMLKETIRQYEEKQSMTAPQTTTNVDILKRLSRLEAEVFKNR